MRRANLHSSQAGSYAEVGWAAGSERLSAAAGKLKSRPPGLVMTWGWGYGFTVGVLGAVDESGERDGADGKR